MGGGTCEASVFHRAGLPTGALCVALNHYHNMGPGTALRAESISLRDWQGLYDFLYFLVTKAKSIAPRGRSAGGAVHAPGQARALERRCERTFAQINH